VISAPFSAHPAVSRCLTRAVEAADRGDRLEAQYWQSAAAAAHRRAAVPSPVRPGILTRLVRRFTKPLAGPVGKERLA
jgi:hypothetical protein